jgi:hypothetical protein
MQTDQRGRGLGLGLVRGRGWSGVGTERGLDRAGLGLSWLGRGPRRVRRLCASANRQNRASLRDERAL